MSLDNNLKYIDVLYNTNPGSLSIPRLQESIPEKEAPTAELTEKIGTSFFVVDLQAPNTLDHNGKPHQQYRNEGAHQ